MAALLKSNLSTTGGAARVRLPFPHVGQQIVRQQAKRFNWLAAGRRWRKTTLVMAIAVEAALKGKRIIWGAPVYDQVRVGWEETKRAAYGVADFNFSRMVARFPNEGSIIYRSLDNPDNVRSHTADGVVMDECGDVQQAAWYEVLRPMLMDTQGDAWGIGSAKGYNWFAKEVLRASGTEDSMSWQVPTLGVRITDQGLVRAPHPMENPNIPFDEIVSLYETQPEATFRQEVLSEFIRGEGAVFRNIAANMKALESAPSAHAGHRTVAGVDWAQKHDFTAISVGCVTCKQELELDRFNKIEWAFQRGRLRAVCDRWKVSDILAEENSIGSPNIEALQAENLPVRAFQTTASSKPPLIQSLALSLEKVGFQFLNVTAATAEMEAYESHVNKNTGRVGYSAPEGMHDDTVIARALMLHAINGGLVVSDDERAAFGLIAGSRGI